MTDEETLLKIKELCGYGYGYRPENERLVQAVSHLVFKNVELGNLLERLNEIVEEPDNMDLDAVYDSDGGVVGRLPQERYARGVGDKILGKLKET